MFQPVMIPTPAPLGASLSEGAALRRGPSQVLITVDGQPVPLDTDNSAQITATGLGEHEIVASITDQYGTSAVAKTYSVVDGSDSTPPIVSLSGISAVK